MPKRLVSMNPYKFAMIHKLEPEDCKTLQAEMVNDEIITQRLVLAFRNVP
jgi:hypothetical protein